MDTARLKFDPTLARQLQRDITGEIYKAIRCPDIGIFKEAIRLMVNKPTRKFAEVMADFDAVIKERGLRQASLHLLAKLTDSVTSVGEEIIPGTGPVIVASNHPGTYDGLSIVSRLPREDVKIIVGANPFFQNLPNGREFLIFSTREQPDRVDVIRKSIKHLTKGGLLLIFPGGRIDPDPAILPGAEEGIRKWSRSLAVFLKKATQSQLVLAITSGVITDEFINHPLPNLFSNGPDRRRIVEFMQVIKQMVMRREIPLKPRLLFELEKRLGTEGKFDLSERMDTIQSQALALLNKHLQIFYPVANSSN